MTVLLLLLLWLYDSVTLWLYDTMMELFSMSHLLRPYHRYSKTDQKNFCCENWLSLRFCIYIIILTFKIFIISFCIFLLYSSSYLSLSLSYSINFSVTLSQILSVLGLSGLFIYSFNLSCKFLLESEMKLLHLPHLYLFISPPQNYSWPTFYRAK